MAFKKLSNSADHLLFSNIANHEIYGVEDEYALGLFKGAAPIVSHLCPGRHKQRCFHMKLGRNFPQLKYKKQNKWRWPLHWGSLKILINQIQLLSMVSEKLKNFRFVYCNISRAKCFKYKNTFQHLRDLFPCVTFDYVDELRDFPDDLPIVLYCDINIDDLQTEMHMQLKYWEQLRPIVSSLKFLLDYTDGINDTIYRYLDGQIMLQAYTGNFSTETRLIVRQNSKLVKYSCMKYEQQMYFHNFIMRNSRYEVLGNTSRSLKKDILCNCYDCCYFSRVIEDYANIMQCAGSVLEIVSSLLDILGNTIYNKTISQQNRIWAYTFFKSYKLCSDPDCIYCCYGRLIQEKDAHLKLL